MLTELNTKLRFSLSFYVNKKKEKRGFTVSPVHHQDSQNEIWRGLNANASITFSID